MKVKISSFVVVFFITIFVAKAQDTLIEKKEIGEAFVKALRPSKKAPFVNTTISHQDLQQNNNGVDLPVLLNNQTSVVTNSDAGNGIGYTGIRMRGSDITRINVTMNGIPVNDAESQSVYFVNTPDMASSAQSINIQRGVGSSTNGPASFGGTININNIYLKQKREISIQNDLSSFNTLRNTLMYNSGVFKNKFNFFVRGSHLKSDGYIARSDSKLWSIQATASYNLNPKTNIVFNFLQGKEKTGQAWNGVYRDSLLTNRTMNELGIMENGDYYNNQTDNYQQRYFQLFLNKQIRPNKLLNIAAYYTRGYGFYEEYKLAQTYSSYGLPDYTDTATGTTYTESSMVRQLWLSNHLVGALGTYILKNKKSTYTFGLAANTYIANHFGKVISAKGLTNNHTWYDLNANKTEASVFAKLEYSLSKKINFYGDLQARNVYYTINGFRRNPNLNFDLDYLFINPKLGLNYILIQNENKNARVFASLAIANKEPNRDDLEAGALQTPKPENLTDYEIGFEFQAKKLAINLNYFYMNYKNQLVNNGKINDVGAYTRINVAESFRMGTEFEIAYKPNSNFLASGNITLSQNKIKQFVNYIDNYDTGTQDSAIFKNVDIAFSPNTIAALNFSYSFLQYKKSILKPSIWLTAKYVSKQYLDNTQDALKVLNEFTTIDGSVKFDIAQEKSKMQLRLGVLNILNTLYEPNGYTFSYIYGGQLSLNNYYFPQAGRRFSVGLGIVF